MNDSSYSQLPLPGLKGSDPIGFLAAVGLLRIVTPCKRFGRVKLGWSDDSGSSAILFTEEACSEDELVASLLDGLRGRAGFSVFAGVTPDGQLVGAQAWDDVKVPCSQFVAMLEASRSVADRSHREHADFFSGLGSELVTLRNRDIVKPSALHMTSGNQAFLASVRELVRSLDPDLPPHPDAATRPREALTEAIFARQGAEQLGWRAADRFSAMGFDPEREAVYALTASAPADTGARSTRAAVWLAVEAIPLFPVFPRGEYLHTRGFDRRLPLFRWPLWEGAFSIDTVRTAVGLLGLLSENEPTTIFRKYSIKAVMQSERVSIGQGYGQLRPASRLI